jgi:hypothetical protein
MVKWSFGWRSSSMQPLLSTLPTGNPNLLSGSFLFLFSSLLPLRSPPVVLAGRKLALNIGTILEPLRMGLMAWQRRLWYVFHSCQ